MTLTKVSSRLIEDTLRYVLGASGTNHYTFTGKGLTGAVNDPTLTLSRGHTYVFENRNASGAHPFYIKTSIANGGTNDAYNTGVTNNGGAGGTEIVFTVPHDAPDVLYYQCSSHINMAGQLKIAGGVADGSITTAKLEDSTGTTDGVTTAKIANTAVTNAKLSGDIAANKLEVNDAHIIIGDASNDGTLQTLSGDVSMTRTGAVTIADEAITLAKLEHGDANNDGKFLRANNGADPSFETITIPQAFVSGMIILWSGNVNSVPNGWVICDGSNNTPDLRDKFVVGANNTYAVGATGGATTDSVSISISGSTGVESVFGSNGYIQPSPHSGRPQHNHSFSGSGSATVDTLPPYYALLYIMKT